MSNSLVNLWNKWRYRKHPYGISPAELGRLQKQASERLAELLAPEKVQAASN